MNANKEAELLQIVEEILKLDPAMRFAAILDLDGKILEGIMKESKTSLESQNNRKSFVKMLLRQEKCEKFMIVRWAKFVIFTQKEKT